MKGEYSRKRHPSSIDRVVASDPLGISFVLIGVSAQEMLRQGGFTVVHREGVHGYPLPEGLNGAARLVARSKRRLRAWLTGLRPTVFAYQFILVAVPAIGAPEAQPLREKASQA